MRTVLTSLAAVLACFSVTAMAQQDPPCHAYPPYYDVRGDNTITLPPPPPLPLHPPPTHPTLPPTPPTHCLNACAGGGGGR
jgi:hypothetical protein